MSIFFIQPSGVSSKGGVFLKGSSSSQSMSSLKSDNRTQPVGPVDNEDSSKIIASIKFANDVTSVSQKTTDKLNSSSYDNLRKSIHYSTSDRLTADQNHNPVTNQDSVYKKTGKVSFGTDLQSNSIFINNGSQTLQYQSDDEPFGPGDTNEPPCPELYDYSSKPGVFGTPIVTTTKINTPPCSSPLCLFLEYPDRYIKLKDLPVGQTFTINGVWKYIKIEGEYNAQQLDDFDQPIEGAFENIDPNTKVANPDRCAKWVCKDKDENGNIVACRPDEPEDCRDNLGNNTFSDCLDECIDYRNHCKHLDTIAGKSMPGANLWREDLCTCWCSIIGSENAKQACLDLGYDDIRQPSEEDYRFFLETGVALGRSDQTTCECECESGKRYDTELKRCVDIVTKGACCYVYTDSDGVKTRRCNFMDQSTCVSIVGTFYPNKGCKEINNCENCYTDDDSKKINLCDTGQFEGQCIECESNEYFIVHNGECQCMTCAEMISNDINLCYTNPTDGFYGDMYEATFTLEDNTQITVCRCCGQNQQYKDCLKNNNNVLSPCAYNCENIGGIEDVRLVWDEEKCECVCPEGSSNPECQMANNNQFIIDPNTCQCICPDSIRQSCLERGFAFYAENYFDGNLESSRLKKCTCDCGSNPIESEKLKSCPAQVYDLENCICHCDKLGPGGEPLYILHPGHVYNENCLSVCPQQLELGLGPLQLPTCPNREDGADGYFDTTSCECLYPCDPPYHTILCPGYSINSTEDHVFCVECENKEWITPCSMVNLDAGAPYNAPRCNPPGAYCKISDSYEGYCVSNDYNSYLIDSSLGITFGSFNETQYCDGDGRYPILDCSYTTEPPVTTTPIVTTTMAPDKGACCYRVNRGDWECEDNKTARGCEIISRDVGAVDVKFLLGEYCSEGTCASPWEYGACYKVNLNYLGRCISCIDNVLEDYCNEIDGTSFFAEEQCNEGKKTEVLKERIGCNPNDIVDLDNCRCVAPPPPSGCFATWYAEWNCDSEEWQWYGSAEPSKWCGEASFISDSWAPATVNGSDTWCIQTYNIFSPGDCTKDSDCSDMEISTTPPFPSGGPPTDDYASCCPPVCTYILSTSYDCDTEEWSLPTLTEADCLERSPGMLSPIVYDEWRDPPQTFGVPVDPCVKIMRRKSSECDGTSPCLNYILVFGESPSDMIRPDYVPHGCCGGSSGGDTQSVVSKSYVYNDTTKKWTTNIQES